MPEQRVLRKACRPVGHVEAARDPLVDRRVLRTLGVEEIERRASDVEPPDLDDDVATAERDGDGERAVAVGDKSGRNTLGVDLEPVLVLVARLVHALLEIALPVEEPDAHHRAAPCRTPP